MAEEIRKVPNAIIVNDLPCDSELDRIHIERITSTRYDKKELLSTVPSCACGETKMGFNLGVTCTKCGTEVTMNASNIQSELWIRAPDSIAGLILPIFAVMLNDALKIGGKKYSGFAYLLNPSHKEPKGNDGRVKLFKRFFGDVPRGINNFIANIELILERIELFNQKRGRELSVFYRMHKDKVFPEYLAIPSRLTMLVEDTNVYTYYDKAIDKAIESVYTVAGISTEASIKKTETRIATAILNLAEYLVNTFETMYAGKPGLMRKAILGSRLPYALRAIVTSIHGPHDYRFAKIPKSLAVMIMKPAIMGKLRRQGMTHVEAYDYVKANTLKPTQRIMDILYEFVEESRENNKKVTGRDEAYLTFNITRYLNLPAYIVRYMCPTVNCWKTLKAYSLQRS